MRLFIINICTSILLLCSIAYLLVFDDKGRTSYIYRLREAELKTVELLELSKNKAALEAKLSLLSPEELNLDFVDELARKKLGYIGNKELVVKMTGEQNY